MQELLNIEYRWGGWGDPADGLDCIGYADYIRRHFSLPGLDYAQLRWIYNAYPRDIDSPLELVQEVARQVADPVTEPAPFDLALMLARRRVCIGTLLPNGDLAWMSGGRESIVLPLARAGEISEIRGFVRPLRLVLPYRKLG